MKKFLYLLIAFGFVFTSCEPVEDIHEDIDPTIDETIVGEVAFTLNADDYETAGVDTEYFNSVDQARELIPNVLEYNYPAWGKSSIAYVTFNYDAELLDQDGEPVPPIEYTVTDQDYEDMGLNFGNFDDVNDLYAFLDYKFSTAENGTEVILTYDWYDGSVNTLTDVFFLNEGNWSRFSSFTSDDYDAMNQSFPNFNTQEDALQIIPIYMRNQLYPYAEAGDVQNVAYELHIGGGNTEYHRLSYEFDGENWILLANGSLITEMIQFGHNGEFWEPDNTIPYTLNSADFTLIGEAFEGVEGFDDPAWSAGNYANFDRREGNQNYWSNVMILQAINVVLNNNFPSAEEGQKFLVSYAIYDGAAGVEQMHVIKEGGEYLLVE